ncbi:hypothetical protein GF377_01920, partial [candidate division GN15 bacterium]|nr:hypothetical protein [candidate division GN15 bacterium]
MNPVTKLMDAIRGGTVLLTDGAIGTRLPLADSGPATCPEWFTLKRPDLLTDITLRYIEAGADIVQTNTFGANARRLAACGLTDHVDECNTLAVLTACEAAEAARHPVYVAGTVGPTGLFTTSSSSQKQGEALDVF